jgi:hypothetical protein
MPFLTSSYALFFVTKYRRKTLSPDLLGYLETAFCEIHLHRPFVQAKPLARGYTQHPRFRRERG